jgi:hypothetical protein
MENQPKKWICPHPDCRQKEFNSQGKGGHLYSKHGVRTEDELLEVLKGKEIKLIPYTPGHISKTETVTRVTKHLFETPVSTPVEYTHQTPIKIEQRRVETPVQKHVSETPVKLPNPEPNIRGECELCTGTIEDSNCHEKLYKYDEPGLAEYFIVCQKHWLEIQQEKYKHILKKRN